MAWRMEGQSEPSLVVFVCLSRSESEGCEMSCCEDSPAAGGSAGPSRCLPRLSPQVTLAEGCRYDAVLAMGSGQGWY